MIRNLDFYRKKKGITLEELADRVGITASYLHMLKSGRKRYNADMLQKISMELGCKDWELIAENHELYGLSDPIASFRPAPPITDKHPIPRPSEYDIAEAGARAWKIAENDFPDGFEVEKVYKAGVDAIMDAGSKNQKITDHLLRHYLHMYLDEVKD